MIACDGFEEWHGRHAADIARLGTAGMKATTDRRVQWIWNFARDFDALVARKRIWNCRNQSTRVGVLRIGEKYGFPVARLDNATEIHDGDPVAHVFDHAQIVADHHVGQSECFLQFQQKIDDLRPDRDVKGGNRLVEER